MKNLLLSGFLLFAALGFTACSDSDNPEPEAKLTLSASKKSMLADGNDHVRFTVRYEGTDVSSGAKITCLTTGNEITDRLFTTTTAGSYKFQATYKDETSPVTTVVVKSENTPENEVFYHNVHVMRVTGTWCMACPTMDEYLDEYEKTNPGRLIRTSFHMSASDAPDPMHTSETVKVISAFGIQSFPTGVFDWRYTCGNNNSQIKQYISQLISNYPATSGIAIESSLQGRKATIKATVKSSQTDDYTLGILIVEDGIVAPQNNLNVWIENYVHDGAVRYLLTPITGTDLGTVEKDKEEPSTFTIDIDAKYNLDKCRVVAYTMKNTSGVYHINNSATCPINGTVDYRYN